MASSRTSSSRRPIKKGGMFLPALCNIIGTLILVAVIATSIPLAIPRFLGYEVFNVETGSMEPAIPVGSVVYVEAVEPRAVDPGEVIAFYSNGAVITHRVVMNQYFYEEFVTKGDANDKEDINPIPYTDLIGRVKYHIPVLGNYLMVYSNPITSTCWPGCSGGGRRRDSASRWNAGKNGRRHAGKRSWKRSENSTARETIRPGRPAGEFLKQTVQ